MARGRTQPNSQFCVVIAENVASALGAIHFRAPESGAENAPLKIHCEHSSHTTRWINKILVLASQAQAQALFPL